MQTLTKPGWSESTKRLLDTLCTSPQGLSAQEAIRRQQQYGRNVLPSKRAKGPFQRFLLQFHQPLIYVLLVAGSITTSLGEYVDAAVIFAGVLVNALVGFLQEAKALDAINALSSSLKFQCTVVRDGIEQVVSSTQIVPGDIVIVASGDKIPADLRLIVAKDIQIAEAVLTGESVPVAKNTEELEPDTALVERTNMAFAGTLVTRGRAIGVAVATGQSTEVGRISQLITGADDLATPLTRKIEQFSKFLLWSILALSAVNFVIGLLRQQPMIDIFLGSVALSVAAIPEGLPAAMTIILAIGVSRMAKRKAIIRKLPAVEALGSTTVICSDKTGTLTQNSMTVTRIYAGEEVFCITGNGYEAVGKISLESAKVPEFSVNDFHGRVALLECLRSGALCNDSHVDLSAPNPSVDGDPTEAALLIAAAKAGLMHRDLNEQFPRIDAIPFESDNQFMATLHDGFVTHRTVFLKGSVERVLVRCKNMLNARGQTVEMNQGAIAQQASGFAQDGLRVLALAYKNVRRDTTSITMSDVDFGFTFVGLQAMIDPPRADAADAVARCSRAGIRVKMITGDHALTARSIAAQLGIGVRNGAWASVLTGADISACAPDDLPAMAAATDVFARVAPEQKLLLVKALQHSGNVVCMTGDGVNDAPALKQADIGVAMGLNGTDVARESSDIILADDNFATIAAAVEEGRSIFNNLMKFIVWTLPTNIAEGMVILVAVLVGAALPIVPVQILWINMTTAIFLGMTLAFEPGERGIMSLPPRASDAPILTFPVLMRMALMSLLLLVGSFGTFYWLTAYHAATLAEARTVAVNIFVFGEMFYLFNCRSLIKSAGEIGWLSNKAALVGVAIMTMLQLGFTYLPVMNKIFHTVPVEPALWLLILGFGAAVFVIVELEKKLTRAVWLKSGQSH